MRNTLNLSKVTPAMILFLSLLCVHCNKKEEGKLTITTKPVTDITTESAKCGGDVSSTGNFSIGNCGVCWNTAPSPTIDDYFTTDNQGTGNYTSFLNHLSSGTKYYVRAYATTSSGIMYGEELDFTTEALPVATLTVYTNDVTEITASTAKCGGVVTSNGNVSVAARGVCWSTSFNPTIEKFHTTDGQGLGAFSSIMTQLAESTSYFVRAYATTEAGETYYGEAKTFTTASNGGGGGGNEVTVTVYTTEVSEITSSTAKSGGVVTANGDVNIIAKGVCWSTSPEPSLTHHTSDGQGLGSFSSNVAGLDENTSYNIWAYATTIDGITIYGDLKTFTTEASSTIIELPTIAIDNVNEITGTSAKCGGTVTSDGGADVTDRGICWSTIQNPMVYHSHVSVGNGTGHFVAEMTGLENGTTYYVRAYATNSEGTNYSTEEKTFTTLAPPTVLTTSPITNITQTSATVGGNVTDDGGETPVRGICWSQAPNPTTNNNPIFSGSGLGEFTAHMTGLLPGTTYHVRAFAKNSVATSYGEDVVFTTDQSSVTLSDFLGVYSVSAYNRDKQRNETWTGTNIATFTNTNTNTIWIKVEGLMDGSNHEYFAALGEFSEEHHAIRLYGGWGFTSNSYQFYFTDEPNVWYYARFFPIYQTTGSTWYYLENGSGYENSSEAWLTMNSDGTVSLGASEYPDDNGRFANGFVFGYYYVENNSWAGRFDRYTNVKLTKTSKTPTNNSEPFIMIDNVKYDTKNHTKQSEPMKASATKKVRNY